MVVLLLSRVVFHARPETTAATKTTLGRIFAERTGGAFRWKREPHRNVRISY